MPHTQSAKKRLRQNEERRIRNKDRTTEMKSIRKKLLRAVHDGQKQEAEALYRDFSKSVDQAASVHTIHRNAAARAKSRLALVITGGPAAAAIVIGKAAAGPTGSTPKSAAPATGEAKAPAKAAAKKPKKPTA